MSVRFTGVPLPGPFRYHPGRGRRRRSGGGPSVLGVLVLAGLAIKFWPIVVGIVVVWAIVAYAAHK